MQNEAQRILEFGAMNAFSPETTKRIVERLAWAKRVCEDSWETFDHTGGTQAGRQMLSSKRVGSKKQPLLATTTSSHDVNTSASSSAAVGSSKGVKSAPLLSSPAPSAAAAVMQVQQVSTPSVGSMLPYLGIGGTVAAIMLGYAVGRNVKWSQISIAVPGVLIFRNQFYER